jgi:hypothetical protein
LLADYGRHAPACAYAYPRNQVCRCGFLDLIDQAKIVLDAPTATPSEPARTDADGGDYRKARGVVPWREGDEKPEDTIRRMRGHSPDMEELDRLRAELATVTAERRAAVLLADTWLEELDKRDAALAAEREHADGLADALKKMNAALIEEGGNLAHGLSSTADWYTVLSDRSQSTFILSRDRLAAHDARRSEGGE